MKKDEKIEMLLQHSPLLNVIKTVETIDALLKDPVKTIDALLTDQTTEDKKKDTLMQHQNTKRYILT